MKKFLTFLGIIPDLEEIKKYEDINLVLTKQERDLLAIIMARFAYMLNSSIDEWESREYIKQCLEEEKLNIISIHQIAMLVNSTIFDPDRDVDH